jgi:glucosamine-6-phosphate isomerase
MRVVRLENQAWARYVAKTFLGRVQANPKLRVCLPSGNTPTPVYAEITRLAREQNVSLAGLKIFLLDEYGGLGADDSGRCAAMLERDFFSKLEERPAHIRLINTDAKNLDAEIAALEHEIGTGFDLAILGIGMNGHLGMNEPGSQADSGVRRVELHAASQQSSHNYGVQKTPTWGVTTGLRQLLGSKEVWLLASGAKKADIVREALEGPITTDNPASLLQARPLSTIFLDTNAASLLNLGKQP